LLPNKKYNPLDDIWPSTASIDNTLFNRKQ
jgi:hypothetical protein